jgi:thioredoxin-like negative regulator of GroEL
MARLELNGGRASEALRLLETAQSRQTANLEMQYLMAQALQALGRDEEATAQFQRVSETENAHSEIRRLTEEIERTPDDVEVRFRIGELTLQFGDPDDAVLWWLSVLDIDPLHRPACRQLADYYSGKAASDPAYRDLAAAFHNRVQALGTAGDAPAARHVAE